MTLLRHLVTAFIGGETDPLLHGRVDADLYAVSLEECVNFVPVNEGPLVKRPGWEYIRDADATSTWLGAFRFSVTQEYVIEWGELKARFFTNGARIETAPNVAYEVVTPYAASQAAALSTQQSYDRLYIDHPLHAPSTLARTSATTFAHAALTVKNGPFLDENTDETITITASGTSGSITLTASAGIFAAGDVGGLMRIGARDFSTIKAWEPGMDAIVAGEVVRSDGKAYTAATSGKTGTKTPIHESGSEWDGQLKNDVLNAKGPYGVLWDFRHGSYGTVRITGYTSATQVTADVVKRLPDQVTTVASWRWAFGAWSTRRGWPSIVLHAFGRQIHFQGLEVQGSVVGDYGGGQVNFERFTSSGITAADLGFRRTIAASNPPLWAVGDRQILVGTASGELIIGAVNSQLALSGDNIKADPQSFYGCEPVFPVQQGTSTVFLERGGRRLRAADYDFGRDRYVPQDLTVTARHITRGGVVQLATQRVPWGMLHAVRADGQIAVHSDTKIDLKGWARMVPGGGARVLSAVCIVGADGKSDELWALVERTRADGVKKEIWRQAEWRETGDGQDQQFFVDCGSRFTASGGQLDFTGFTHLAGQDLAILAAGGVVPGVVCAADGSFSLPAGSVPDTDYTIVVGLGYEARATTLRPNMRLPNGKASQGLKQRLVKAAVRVLETMGLRAGTPEGPHDEIIDRPVDSDMDAPIPLYTGDTRGEIDASWARDGRATFISDRPTNAVISMAMLNVEVDGADA